MKGLMTRTAIGTLIASGLLLAGSAAQAATIKVGTTTLHAQYRYSGVSLFQLRQLAPAGYYDLNGFVLYVEPAIIRPTAGGSTLNLTGYAIPTSGSTMDTYTESAGNGMLTSWGGGSTTTTTSGGGSTTSGGGTQQQTTTGGDENISTVEDTQQETNQTNDTVAVPEPGSLALLGLGLLAIGVARRRAN